SDNSLQDLSRLGGKVAHRVVVVIDRALAGEEDQVADLHHVRVTELLRVAQLRRRNDPFRVTQSTTPLADAAWLAMQMPAFRISRPSARATARRLGRREPRTYLPPSRFASRTRRIGDVRRPVGPVRPASVPDRALHRSGPDTHPGAGSPTAAGSRDWLRPP